MVAIRNSVIYPLSLFQAAALLAAACTIMAFSARADAPKISLQVSPTSGTMDEVYVLAVIIDGGKADSTPFLAGGDGWKLSLIGPRNEVRIVNGQVSSRLSYTYQLIPKQPGTLETPSAEVEIDGIKYRTEPLKVHVAQSGSARPDQEEQVFFRQSVSAQKLYVGQQAVNTLELFSAVRVLQPQIMDLSFDDFYSAELGSDDHSQRVIDGRRYDIIRLKRAIFPLKAGRIIIPARKIQGQVPISRKRRFPFGGMDPFDDDILSGFFSTTEYENQIFTSNAIQLDVSPLPDPPSDLANWIPQQPLVGSVNLKLVLPATAMQVGESRTAIIEITSTANLNPLTRVPLDFAQAARIYPEEPESKVADDNFALVTKKVFRVSLVPTQPGNLRVPPLRLLYFDPDKGQYRVAETQGVTIPVTGAANTPASEAPTTTGAREISQSQPPPAPTQGIPQWYEETILARMSKQLSTGLALLLSTILLAILAAAFYVMRVSSRHKPLQQAKRAIHNASSAEALYLAFEHYLRLKLPAAQTTTSLRGFIEGNMQDPDLRFNFYSALDDFDRLRYSQTPSAAELQNLREKVLALIAAV